MFLSPGHRIQKYLKKHPETKVILVMGSRGVTSAIRAITSILSLSFNVSIGINKKISPDIVILDFRSMQNFPLIKPDFVALTSCYSKKELDYYKPWIQESKYLFYNYNDIDKEVKKELSQHQNSFTYGDERPADFYFENQDSSLHGFKGSFVDPEDDRIAVFVHLIGEHNLRPVSLAAGIARSFKIPREQIINAIESLRPLRGRMSPAEGPNCVRLRGSTAMWAYSSRRSTGCPLLPEDRDSTAAGTEPRQYRQTAFRSGRPSRTTFRCIRYCRTTALCRGDFSGGAHCRRPRPERSGGTLPHKDRCCS